tara:strand:- start:2356 stop:3228 length:873 start_codon:yes stop_codon:yes gene_type:complete
MNKKIFIFGSSGQLGKEFINSKDFQKNFNMVSFNKDDCDITDFDAAKKLLCEGKPDFLINCAAYTNVDNAEYEQEKANLVNNLALSNISKLCHEMNITLIHFSTDYVFDGISKRTIKESDAKNPLNFYGITKHLGEEEVLKNCKKFFIFRVSWIYGKYGNNFPTKIIKFINDNADITVIDDQIGAPISTSAIVTIIFKIISERKLTDNYGIYNISPNNFCSRHDMAEKIKKNFKNYSKEIYRIKSKDLNTDIVRPQYSCLDNAYLKKTFKIELKNWDDYLVSFLEDLYGE